MKAAITAFVALVLLVAAWFAFALNWNYSSGERAGWVQKFSNKAGSARPGRTKLALVSLPGSTVEKIHVHGARRRARAAVQRRDGQARQPALRGEGGPTLHCFGDTRWASQDRQTPDIPLGPGVVLPTRARQPPRPLPRSENTR